MKDNLCRCNATPVGTSARPIEVSDGEYYPPRVATPRVVDRLIPIDEPREDFPLAVISDDAVPVAGPIVIPPPVRMFLFSKEDRI